jgi:hypothetical protein
MKPAVSIIGPARVATWAMTTTAGIVGAWSSYGFGASVGGVLMGIVAAANGAAICVLMTSAVLDRLARIVSA